MRQEAMKNEEEDHNEHFGNLADSLVEDVVCPLESRERVTTLAVVKPRNQGTDRLYVNGLIDNDRFILRQSAHNSFASRSFEWQRSGVSLWKAEHDELGGKYYGAKAVERSNSQFINTTGEPRIDPDIVAAQLIEEDRVAANAADNERERIQRERVIRKKEKRKAANGRKKIRQANDAAEAEAEGSKSAVLEVITGCPENPYQISVAAAEYNIFSGESPKDIEEAKLLLNIRNPLVNSRSHAEAALDQSSTYGTEGELQQLEDETDDEEEEVDIGDSRCSPSTFPSFINISVLKKPSGVEMLTPRSSTAQNPQADWKPDPFFTCTDVTLPRIPQSDASTGVFTSSNVNETFVYTGQFGELDELSITEGQRQTLWISNYY